MTPVRRTCTTGLLAVAAAAATLWAAPVPPPPTTQPAPVSAPRGGHRDPVLPPPLPTVPTSQPATVAVVTTPATAAAPKPPPVVPPPAVPPSSQPAPPTQAGTPPVPVPDSVAYWVGWQAGGRIRQRMAEDGTGFEETQVVKGLIDGLAGSDPAVNRSDVQAAFDLVEANVRQRRAERRAADDPAFRRLADDNEQHSRDLLAENARMPGVRQLGDGVQVQPVHDGAGRPVAAARTVTAKLAVSLADGTAIATADQAHLIMADALSSLAAVVRTMRVGDRWRIVLPAERAYGLAGSPPAVGPNQAIAVDVEVLEAQ